MAISGHFIAMLVLLTAVFLFGGSSRADVPALILLRPLAALLLGYALWHSERRPLLPHRMLFVIAALIVGIPAVQLIPLPPSVWSALPGRGLIVDIDQAAGLGRVWRPISLDPPSTWNSLCSLVVPGAALALILRLNTTQQAGLLPVLIVAISVSALLGVLQSIGPHGGILYFYRVTHQDSAVGLFANRNHQAAALACLLPLWAAFAAMTSRSRELGQWRRLSFVIATLIILPLILITGSRAGLVAGFLGIAMAAAMYWPFRSRSHSRRSRAAKPRHFAGLLAAGVLIGVAALVWITIQLGRAVAFNRLVNWNADSDFRLRAWKYVLNAASSYWPVGSGYGAFVPVFKVTEPYALLQTGYFNQAHNDWIDVVLSGGLPAVLVLIATLIAVGVRTIRLAPTWRDRQPSRRLAWAGLAVMIILAFASVTDYPLRVPSVACIWVVAVVWFVSDRTADRDAEVPEQFESKPSRKRV